MIVDPFSIVWALIGLWIVAALVVTPVWLSMRVVSHVRSRASTSWRMRVGDRERAALARRLGGDYAAGRLTLGELEQRSENAWHAATYADLRAIARDLPPDKPLRSFGLVDLALSFAAGLALLAVTPYVALILAGGILLRRVTR